MREKVSEQDIKNYFKTVKQISLGCVKNEDQGLKSFIFRTYHFWWYKFRRISIVVSALNGLFHNKG